MGIVDTLRSGLPTAGGTRRAALAALLCGLAAGPCAAAGPERLVDAAARQDTHAGIDVDQRRPDGATALLWAAHWDDHEAVRLLLDAVNEADFTALLAGLGANTRLGVPGTVQERVDRAVADT